jgi:hypothetical protein
VARAHPIDEVPFGHQGERGLVTRGRLVAILAERRVKVVFSHVHGRSQSVPASTQILLGPTGVPPSPPS